MMVAGGEGGEHPNTRGGRCATFEKWLNNYEETSFESFAIPNAFEKSSKVLLALKFC